MYGLGSFPVFVLLVIWIPTYMNSSEFHVNRDSGAEMFRICLSIRKNLLRLANTRLQFLANSCSFCLNLCPSKYAHFFVDDCVDDCMQCRLLGLFFTLHIVHLSVNLKSIIRTVHQIFSMTWTGWSKQVRSSLASSAGKSVYSIVFWDGWTANTFAFFFPIWCVCV